MYIYTITHLAGQSNGVIRQYSIDENNDFLSEDEYESDMVHWSVEHLSGIDRTFVNGGWASSQNAAKICAEQIIKMEKRKLEDLLKGTK